MKERPSRFLLFNFFSEIMLLFELKEGKSIEKSV